MAAAAVDLFSPERIEETRQILLTRDFRFFVEEVRPRFIWYPHCERIAGVLQRVADGELRRVMIFCPPRHSKSETVSRLFTAYYLNRYPERFVGLNSYAADLAYTFSRAAQENYRAAGGPINKDSMALGHWETGKGGGMWAAGVGGPIMGKGFHLGVIDDPIKNAEEASSEVVQGRQQEWYQSTFLTREEPGGAVVIIQTRWHERDLSGWLLEEEVGGEYPEGWHIVNLAAIRDEDPEVPPSCTLEPDFRSTGEALCPERYDADRLTKIKERVGGYFFAALFQQMPRPKEGNLFKDYWFKEPLPARPALGARVRAWDLAATEGGGKFTCGLLMSRTPEGQYVIEDVKRGQWSVGKRDQIILDTARDDGAAVAVWLEEEPGSAGKSQTFTLVRKLEGFPVRAERPTGDKEVRARPLAAQMEVGNVLWVKGDWNRALKEEYKSFPTGTFKDQVDAGSLAFNKLAATVTGAFLF
jgi:predicted phage terminase large subunit-like protein